MTPTRDAIANLPRPVRAVELPGGGRVHVRELTVAELKRIDLTAEVLPEGTGRDIHTAVLICASALCEDDGRSLFDIGKAEDLEAVDAALTPSQVQAVCKAAAGPSKDEAKN